VHTHFTDDIINALRVPRDLLLDFFVLFSRFEYALKAANFRKDPPATADVSWNKFRNWLDQLPPKELAPVLQAGRYLIDDPPKRLVVSGDTPSWVTPVRNDQSEVRFLVEGLARARNNLFHGSKWLTAPERANRNEQVISTAVAVLKALLDLPSAYGVRREFEELP
jgi:hypothetical protein